jgi:1,2-diacylglycerol 3-alpha-glucosyltransferase
VVGHQRRHQGLAGKPGRLQQTLDESAGLRLKGPVLMPEPRRLHIAYATDMFDGVKTGGVISARRFVQALRDRHEVTVIAGGPSREGVVGLPRFTIPPFGRVMREMGFIFAWPTRARIEPVLRQADVLHVQFPFYLGIKAAKLARSLGTPVVAASHVLPENMFHNIGIRSEWLMDRTWRFFISALYGRADHVVSPTPFGLEELRRHGLTVPADVITNGIPPQFRPGPAEREPRYRDRFLLLIVSRLATEKRIDVIIEAVRRSRHAGQIQLVLCGRGPEEERLRRLSSTLPVPAELRLVEEDDMPALMRSADLLVHAADVELEGMALLEALGTGLPALVARAPKSAASTLAISDEFRFPAGDVEELSRRIDHFIEHPEWLAAGRQAALAAAEGLRLEASVARLEAIYQRVARPAGATRAAARAA